MQISKFANSKLGVKHFNVHRPNLLRTNSLPYELGVKKWEGGGERSERFGKPCGNS